MCVCVCQVLGKSAVNLKLSHFKQMLKSCRGGVSMLIHRMPGARRTQQGVSVSPRFSLGRKEDQRSLTDFNSPSYQSYQAPGTPGSNLSETTGYYSTQSTSLPSVCSSAISPGAPDAKTGMTSMTRFGHRISPPLRLKSAPSHTSTSQHSGYETDQAGFDSFRDGSTSTSSNSYTTRPTNISPYNPYTRALYLGGGNTGRTRMSSQSSYGGSSLLSSSVLSPKSDAMTNTARFPYSPRNYQPTSFSSTAIPRNSYSVDRLESRAPRRTSGDSHVTSSSSSSLVGPHSMSLSNVYRMELGKRTNV